MGKYGEALGIWEIKTGGADLKVKPRKGDNLELMNIFKKNKDNTDGFFNDIFSFLTKLIERDVPPQNEEEKEELSTFVEYNLIELLKEMMIKFRWATPEDIERALGGDVLKKES